MGDEARQDGTNEMKDRGTRGETEQSMEALVDQVGPIELVSRRAVVGMNDHRRRDEGELIAGQEDLSRPRDVLGDERLGKFMVPPHRTSDARAYVVERAKGQALQS